MGGDEATNRRRTNMETNAGTTLHDVISQMLQVYFDSFGGGGKSNGLKNYSYFNGLNMQVQFLGVQIPFSDFSEIAAKTTMERDVDFTGLQLYITTDINGKINHFKVEKDQVQLTSVKSLPFYICTKVFKIPDAPICKFNFWNNFDFYDVLEKLLERGENSKA